jgi:hypothetical protein
MEKPEVENLVLLSLSVKLFCETGKYSNVPDRRSRDLEVVVVRPTINLGTGNLEWGGNGEGLRKRRSVYE